MIKLARYLMDSRLTFHRNRFMAASRVLGEETVKGGDERTGKDGKSMDK